MVAFLADFIINFNLGFYRNGLFVESRWEIMTDYFGYRMFIDLLVVVIIPLGFFSYSLPVNIIKILFIFKIYRLAVYDRDYLYLLSTKRKSKVVYKLFRLILILVFYCHVLACIFFYMDYTFYINDYNNYVENGYLWLLTAQCMPNIVGQFGWLGRYLYALYWSIGTVSTVGYGDIFPANPWENLF